MKTIAPIEGIARDMLNLCKFVVTGASALAFASTALAQGARIPVVAAENFYGDVVHQLGGDHVDVTSILSNPNQDPHAPVRSQPEDGTCASAREPRRL